MPTVRYTVIDGEVIAEKRNGVRREYVPDPLGSTVALLDNTQTVTDSFSYWPYGEEQARTGTTPTPFEFVGTMGYYKDSGSKTYVRARYLNTGQGRWMTQDPIGFKGGDRNLYRYVENKPVRDIDPSGMIAYLACIAICKKSNPYPGFIWNPIDKWCSQICRSAVVKGCTALLTYCASIPIYVKSRMCAGVYLALCPCANEDNPY